MPTPNQIRAARAMLSWSAAELARRAGVHISTVQRIERNGPALRGNIATLEKVRRALEKSGIEFLDETFMNVTRARAAGRDLLSR